MGGGWVCIGGGGGCSSCWPSGVRRDVGSRAGGERGGRERELGRRRTVGPTGRVVSARDSGGAARGNTCPTRLIVARIDGIRARPAALRRRNRRAAARACLAPAPAPKHPTQRSRRLFRSFFHSILAVAAVVMVVEMVVVVMEMWSKSGREACD